MKRIFVCLLLALLAAMPGQAQSLEAMAESDRLFAEGVNLYNSGNYEEAISLFQQSDKIDKKQLDKDSNRRDYSAMWVASCYYRLGNEEEAKKWDSLFYNQPPVDRRLTVKSDAKELLAQDYLMMGQYQKAIDCFLEAAEIEKEALGEDSYFYANTLYMLGQCYTELGDNKNATQYSLQAWSIRMKTLGLHHLYTAMSQIDVAAIYSLFGHNDQAVELETDDLAIFEAYYGRENPYYTTSLGNLAGYYHLLGQYDTAINLQKQLLEILQRTVGAKAPEYGDALNDLANYYAYTGNYAGAIEAAEQALKILEKAYGRQSAEYASLLFDISDYYSDSGDEKTAMQTQLQAVAIYEKIRDSHPEEYAMAVSNLSVYYINTGDYSKAIQLNLDAMKFLEGTVGTQNLAYATALGALATCNYSLGNYAYAINFEERARLIKRKILVGHEDYSTISSLTSLATYYTALGNYSEAIRYGRQALQEQENLTGKDHPDYARVLSALANTYDRSGDPTTAIELETQALEIISNSLGTDHVRYAESLNSLAEYHADSGNLAKAIDTGTQATAIYERLNGDSSPAYANSLYSLARYHSYSGDTEKAIQMKKKALEIYEDTYGRQSRDYYSALIGLAEDLSATGDHEEAIRLEEQAAETISRTYGEYNEDYASTTAILAYENFANEDYLKTTEYAIKSSTSLYGIIATTFSNLTANERSLFWDKHRDWFEVQMPLFTYSIPTDQMRSLEYDTALMSKGLLLNSETELGNLLLESGDEEAVTKYGALQQNRMILSKLYEQPTSERRMNADSLENVTKRQEQELLKLSKTYGDYTKNLAIGWCQVQEGLSDKDIAIEFIDVNLGSEHVYVALTLTKNDSAPQIVSLFPKSELDGIGKGEYYTTSALSGLVWKPLAQALDGKENVYFSPAGELYNIAIESLPDYEGTGLISDRLNLYRLSSTRELALDRGAQNIEKARIYGGLKYSAGAQTLVNDAAKYRSMDAVGLVQTIDADSLNLRGGVGDLPGTEEEAKKIDRIIGTTNIAKTVYTDTLGTESSFKALSGKRMNVLHIATHGFFWSESEAQERHKLRFLAMSETGSRAKYTEDKMMTRSGLLFAGANYALSGRTLPDGVDDGVLTAKEISVLDLRGLDLVVLSACQTGLGEITGDGVFGLQRGFKKAGANSIVMSLWKVDDDATQIFMAHFYYDLLCEKMTKRASFLDAQHYLRTTEDGKYDRPECWAAFILLDALD